MIFDHVSKYRRKPFHAIVISYFQFMVPRALYDNNGNIILLAEDAMTSEVEAAVSSPEPIHAEGRTSRGPSWNIIHEKQSQVTQQRIPTASHKMPDEVQTKIKHQPSVSHPTAPPQEERIESSILRTKEYSKRLLSSSILEGKSQLSATVINAKTELKDAKKILSNLPRRLHGKVKNFWKIANTPVHFPALHKKAGRKPPTKLKLFIVDTIRFGGTFAGIFVVLFLCINYQSFLQIASADLAFGDGIKTQQDLQNIVSGKPSFVTPSNFLESSNAPHNLVAYLPSVGPYEDRLIIPKLGKNVPIVRPSMNALVQEDWKKFEDDIQVALRDGVVHYPGSARPGQAGNFFVTGHSSYYPWDEGKYKDIFARLHELEPGDTYSVYYGGDLHTYRITSKKEVKPNDVSVLDQPTKKRLATLMTCTPIGTTLRRLIVMAEEIDPATGIALQVGEKATDTHTESLGRLESLPI